MSQSTGQDPGPSNNPPIELPLIETALARIGDLRAELARMTDTINTLETTIQDIRVQAALAKGAHFK